MTSPHNTEGSAERLFRVEGDWYGGGFGYTMPFRSSEEAYLWGAQKARFHRDAEITVTERATSQQGERA